MKKTKITNRERINQMTNAQLVFLMQEFRCLNIANHVDLDAWLNSSKEEWIIKGKPGKIRKTNLNGSLPEYAQTKDVIITENEDITIAGVPYTTVIEKRHNRIGEVQYEIYKVPAELVCQ